MIGLTPLAARLYAVIVELFNEKRRPLTRAEIIRAAGYKPNRSYCLFDPLIKRKFVGVDKANRIVPWTSPHEIVCADVCAAMSLTMDEIRSRSKQAKLVRARRLITRRLRVEYNWQLTDIAKVINRGLNTVDEYFHRERAVRRSKQRVQRHRAQQHREMGIAA